MSPLQTFPDPSNEFSSAQFLCLLSALALWKLSAFQELLPLYKNTWKSSLIRLQDKSVWGWVRWHNLCCSIIIFTDQSLYMLVYSFTSFKNQNYSCLITRSYKKDHLGPSTFTFCFAEIHSGYA